MGEVGWERGVEGGRVGEGGGGEVGWERGVGGGRVGEGGGGR